jgi:hypothetical protein
MEEKGRNVLLVTNLVNEKEISQIKQAITDAQQQNLAINLNLVHIIPSLPTSYFNIPSMVLLAEQYYDDAKQYITTVGESLNIAKKNQWLITGRLKTEVLRLAGKLNCSYILASSDNMKDLQQALSVKKEHLTLLFRNNLSSRDSA